MSDDTTNNTPTDPPAQAEPDEVAPDVQSQLDALVDSDIEPEGDEVDPEGDDAEGEGEGEGDPEGDDRLTLAEALGIEEDLLTETEEGKVMLKAVIDGEAKDVSLSDALDVYRKAGAVDKRFEEVHQARLQVQEQVKAYDQTMQQQFAVAAQYVDSLEQQVIGQFNSAEMEQLRSTNPAEYAARNQDLMNRKAAADQMKQELSLKAQQHQQQMAAEQQKAMNEHMANESRLTLEAIPEWSKREVMEADMKAMHAEALDYGFTEEEWSQINDHRLVRLLRNHTLLKAKKERMTPKGAPVPKARQKMRSLSRRRAQTQPARDHKAAIDAHRKTQGKGVARGAQGSIEDVLMSGDYV